MNWSKEWPSNTGKELAEAQERGLAIEWPKSATAINAIWQSAQAPVLTGVDLGTGERLILTEIKDGEITHTDITKEYKNNVPTHDPYANPDAQIYYQCECGAVLDPGTKSFAALNNAAMASGWKVRWGPHNYIPYCVKCGEDVE